jgi:rod shape-determining protein MreD
VADPLSFGVSRTVGSILPCLSAVLLVLSANLPVSLSGGILPAPLLAITAIYFWGLVRPDLMPPFAVLLIGLMEDMFSGGPPGVWATGFMAAYGLVDRQRDNLAGLAGIFAVVGFAAAMALAAFATYTLTWIMYLRVPPVTPILLTSVMTVLFYPVVAVILGWVHRRAVGSIRMAR